ncbi:hypothetical protein CMV_020311 [Castanea mollissima]|uniref:Uncharacterized protein n=1 Tax=Castanea mollissima TaxID=60419 RepID=A0A8J4VLU7_9ROSI|nr:hypothetical protein CMV_020311 [Castanea mollissima]
MGFPILHNQEPTSPFRMVVGASPASGDQRPLYHIAQASEMSSEPHEVLDTKAMTSDHTVAVGAHAEESSAPLEEAGTVRNQISTVAMCSAGQTVMVCRPAKTPTASQCPPLIGFCTNYSLVLLERVGCLVENSAEAECLFSEGTRANELPITMGQADLEAGRALRHTVF